MLARVVKAAAASGTMPIRIPLIGGDGVQSFSSGVQQFMVPELEPIEIVTEPEPFLAVEDDLTADDLLMRAQEEAARIIAQAEEHAVTIEQIASEKAVQRAKAELAAENAEVFAGLRDQLANTIVEVGAIGNDLTTNIEQELVELAIQIAKKVVAREVTIDREIALTLVKVSLAKLHNRSIAEVHLNPEDYAHVKDRLDQLDFRGKIDLVEDRSITIGGCLIHTETGDIDARIESQFDEISHGLLN
ncbi:MAG: FliH/SctL family protein [Pyrinomonadaceae bacterium]